MNFFSGILFLCFAVILFGIEMLFFRNPRLPEWAEGYVVISTSVIAILGIGSTGLILLIFSFKDAQAIGWGNWVLSAIAIGVTIPMLWFLKIPKKLKEFESSKAAIIKLEPVDSSTKPKSGLGSKSRRLAA